MRRMRSRCLVLLVTIFFCLAANGCGTIFHPRRSTETPSNRIDGTAMVLDCVLLIFWIIPGVIALAIDFGTGAIYYSEEELQAKAGKKISVNAAEHVTTDCEVALGLVEPSGRETCKSVMLRQGEKIGDRLDIVTPDNLEPGSKLTLRVQGHEVASWPLVVSAN